MNNQYMHVRCPIPGCEQRRCYHKQVYRLSQLLWMLGFGANTCDLLGTPYLIPRGYVRLETHGITKIDKVGPRDI